MAVEQVTVQKYSIELPVLSFRFRGDVYPVFFPFWRWKMNAFSDRHKENDRMVVTIRLLGNKCFSTEHERLVYQSVEGFSCFQIHALDNGCWLFTIRKISGDFVYLQYLFDEAKREITLTTDQTDTVGMAFMESLVRFLPGLLLHAKTILLHGALVEYEGRGIILSAPSGTGKSTHAHLWRDHKNALILNGDLSACYKKADETRTMWRAFGMPWCGTSGEYMNREVGISAIVALEQSNKNSVSRLSGFDAFAAILPQLQQPIWNKALSVLGVDLLCEMVSQIPVFRLCCRPDIESVEVLERVLKEL